MFEKLYDPRIFGKGYRKNLIRRRQAFNNIDCAAFQQPAVAFFAGCRPHLGLA